MDPLKVCWVCHSRNQSESSDAKPISFFSAIRLLQQDGTNSPEIEIQQMLTCIFDLKFPPGTNIISCSPCACKLVNLYNLRLQFLKNVNPQAMLQPYISEMLQKTTVIISPGQEIPIPTTVNKMEVDLDIDESDSEVDMKPDMLLLEDEEEEAADNEPEQEESNSESESSSNDFDEHALSGAKIPPPLPPSLYAQKNPTPPPGLVGPLNSRPGSFVKIQLLHPFPTPTPQAQSHKPTPLPAAFTRMRVRIQPMKPKKYHLKKTLDHIRLTGSCNRKNCTLIPEFQKVRRSDIYSHLLNTHGESNPEKNVSFYCSKCLKPMPSDPSLTYVYDEHFINFHGNSNPVPENTPNFPQLNSKCGLKFQITFSTIPGQRKKRERQKRDMTCTICNKVFNTNTPVTTMRVHMEMCHGQEAKYSCDICGKPQASPHNVLKHRKKHRNAEERKDEPKQRKNFDKVNCDICGANLFATGLQRHKDTIHAPKGQRKVFFCKLCKFSSLGERPFNSHMRDFHSSDSPLRFYCPRCNQGFVRKLQLKEHGLICCDENERPFPCHICPKRFKIKPNLSIHLMDGHEMSREQVREKLYPGLPMPDWWGRAYKTRKSKNNQSDAAETTNPKEIEDIATTVTPTITPTNAKRTSLRIRKKTA